jgi:ubiquitin carboxyl-terminal hydrolase 22/27/51
MLRRFVAPEKLGKAYDCAQCGPGQNAKRRLCVKKLPPVLSFQLKVNLALEVSLGCRDGQG